MVSSPGLVLLSCRFGTAPRSSCAWAMKVLIASVVITAAKTARVVMAMMPVGIFMSLGPWFRNVNIMSCDYQR